MKINRIVTWNTTKVASGYKFTVISLDHKVPTIVHQTGVASSRAKAKTRAIKWVRYVKAVQKAA